MGVLMAPTAVLASPVDTKLQTHPVVHRKRELLFLGQSHLNKVAGFFFKKERKKSWMWNGNQQGRAGAPRPWAPATTLNHSDLPTFQIWPRCQGNLISTKLS